MQLYKIYYLALILLLVVCITPAVHARRNDEYEQTDTLLRTIEKAQQDIHTLETQFYQKKYFAAMNRSVEFRGTLYYEAPDHILWHYQEPDVTYILVQDKKVLYYIPELKSVNEFHEQDSGVIHLFKIGIENSPRLLKRYFEITPGKTDESVLLELDPVRDVADILKGVRIWFSIPAYFPYRTVIHEQAGNVTETEFFNIKINEPLQPGVFDLAIPEDALWRRPT